MMRSFIMMRKWKSESVKVVKTAIGLVNKRNKIMYTSFSVFNDNARMVCSPRFLSTSSSADIVPVDYNNYLPIDFNSSSRISGAESQIVTISLLPNQILRAESGAMIYMTEGVQMHTNLEGGISSGFKRMLTGQNLFVSDFTYTGPTQGEVALGTDFPSKLLRLNLDDYADNTLICQQGAFLCAPHTISIEMEFTKSLTGGFFGGEGFILQKLTGTGDVFVKAGGMLVRRVLQSGETLRISSGCLVAFTRGVEYDVQMVSGFKNVMFGGEGLFFTTLTGPGTVWLQSMPPDRMISEIARKMPSAGPGIGLGIPLGGGSSTSTSTETTTDVETIPAVTDDAAVEANRQATVASSGWDSMDSTSVHDNSAHLDPDSPASLFGDAAHKDHTSAIASDNIHEEDYHERYDSAIEDTDSTSFSTESNIDNESKDFDDNTKFDDSSVDFGGDEVNQTAEAAKSILSQLWDFFNRD